MVPSRTLAEISLAGWLIGIATSRIADNMRGPGHLREGTDVSAEAIRIGDRMLVANALQGLPKRTRMAVELALIEGLTHLEIAQRAGLPLQTVECDIRRGAERIRRDLMPRTA